MSIQAALQVNPGPYSRPPPLIIKFVDIKSVNKIVKWEFTEGGCKPTATTKQAVCAITDGSKCAKVTLVEELLDKVQEGGSYAVKGYTIKDGAILFNKNSLFFTTSTINTTAEMEAEARSTLNPPSTVTSLSSKVLGKLVTVEGVITELSMIQRAGTKDYPLRKLTLQEDGTSVKVTLWREAVLETLAVGDRIIMTHVKGVETSYGYQLNATNFTTFKKADGRQAQTVGVLGTMGNGDILQILLEDGRVLTVSRDLWVEAVGHGLPHTPYLVDIEVQGTEIKLVNPFA